MDSFSDEKNVLPTHSLDELIKKLHEVFEQDRVNVEYVKALLSSYKSNPKDWKKYAKFDPYRYTRNLVDEGNGKFNLMALCWGEGHGSSIHDHADAHCFVKILDGDLKETLFAWPKESEEAEPLQQLDATVYSKDGVTYMCDELGLHRMENPSHSEGTVSLHLYSPPFQKCLTFDEKSGHQNEVKMTFWSKFGKRTPIEVKNFDKDGKAPVPLSCAVLHGYEPENN